MTDQLINNLPASSSEPLPDLWPVHFETPESLPPVALLRYQATLLGTKTRHIVEAVVESRAPAEAKGTVYHNFYLIAPLLGDYKYKLFFVAHNLDYAHAKITISNGEEEVLCVFSGFEEALKQWLHRPKTQLIVTSLIKQSSALDEADTEE